MAFLGGFLCRFKNGEAIDAKWRVGRREATTAADTLEATQAKVLEVLKAEHAKPKPKPSVNR